MGARIKHLKTILRHKHYVFCECAKCGMPVRGLIHDLSKFSLIEFNRSAQYFQGNRSPIEAEKESNSYSIAWLHHKGCNKHHWEWWTDFNDNGEVIANKIPYKYVVEMVCDWIGAGKAYSHDWHKEDVLTYYRSHRIGRHFHPETEWLIMLFLNIIAKDGLRAFHSAVRDTDIRKRYGQ